MDSVAEIFEAAAAVLERDPDSDMAALIAAVPILADTDIPFVRQAIKAILMPRRPAQRCTLPSHRSGPATAAGAVPLRLVRDDGGVPL